MTLNESNNTELSDEQMDDLVAGIDKPRNSEIPMHDPKEGADGKEKDPKEASEKVKEEFFEFSHNGKQVKATRDQLVRWAQQGINYPQRAQELNAQQSKWAQDKAKYDKEYAEYKKIDEWAKQNPDQWTRLQQSYQQVVSGQPTQTPGQAPAYDPHSPVIQRLQSQIQEMAPIVQEFQNERAQSKVKAEDTALEGEIQSIREKYKDLDWNTLNDRGMSDLEYRVLEHAQKTGIPSFAVAFRDLLHDELMQKASTQAKLNVSTGIQNRSRLGLLDNSSPKQNRIEAAKKPMRETSYEDIMDEIRGELRAKHS